jgi:hypothetical protein
VPHGHVYFLFPAFRFFKIFLSPCSTAFAHSTIFALEIDAASVRAAISDAIAFGIVSDALVNSLNTDRQVENIRSHHSETKSVAWSVTAVAFGVAAIGGVALMACPAAVFSFSAALSGLYGTVQAHMILSGVVTAVFGAASYEANVISTDHKTVREKCKEGKEQPHFYHYSYHRLVDIDVISLTFPAWQTE